MALAVAFVTTLLEAALVICDPMASRSGANNQFNKSVYHLGRGMTESVISGTPCHVLLVDLNANLAFLQTNCKKFY
ncbi:MAG: hypothetical protein U5J62_08400 [Desulfurivibrio sp.]|nr:hypothetical protein [Desulfurivibrio sp.]